MRTTRLSGSTLLLTAFLSLGWIQHGEAADPADPDGTELAADAEPAGARQFWIEPIIEEGVKRLMRSAVRKLGRGDLDGAEASAEEARQLANPNPGEPVRMMVMRIGMFAETLTPNLLVLVAHVWSGRCALAAPLFPIVESELRDTPGGVFGSNGVRALRQRCP
jgi:hypothetical protein